MNCGSRVGEERRGLLLVSYDQQSIVSNDNYLAVHGARFHSLQYVRSFSYISSVKLRLPLYLAQRLKEGLLSSFRVWSGRLRD